jgi:hypothetical protein
MAALQQLFQPFCDDGKGVARLLQRQTGETAFLHPSQ